VGIREIPHTSGGSVRGQGRREKKDDRRPRSAAAPLSFADSSPLDLVELRTAEKENFSFFSGAQHRSPKAILPGRLVGEADEGAKPHQGKS
jgi:hypothetical protein